MTEKIPDFILLKESRKEVGALKSEIGHLQYRIRTLQQRLLIVLRNGKKYRNRVKEVEKAFATLKGNLVKATELRKEELYNNLLKRNKKLQAENNRLRETRDILMSQINSKK